MLERFLKNYYKNEKIEKIEKIFSCYFYNI